MLERALLFQLFFHCLAECFRIFLVRMRFGFNVADRDTTVFDAFDLLSRSIVI